MSCLVCGTSTTRRTRLEMERLDTALHCIAGEHRPATVTVAGALKTTADIAQEGKASLGSPFLPTGSPVTLMTMRQEAGD